jgi:hypothetical protein
MTILACLVCFSFNRTGAAQNTVGSTTVDIDPISGFVVATCETDLDADTEAFYRAGIECKIRDSDGKEIATGQSFDKNGAQGFAQVILIVMGIPGTTYTVTGSHLVDSIFDSAKPSIMGPPGERLYYDPFDFSRLEDLHETYSNLFEWVGHAQGTRIQK